ncbi:hypothetical protein RhiJN_23474 [Ceratobasidium sp. AG-Ba]|nr:hypothetical protein RhiJN_23474 [Ceratobasidium sp. AG-Ba]
MSMKSRTSSGRSVESVCAPAKQRNKGPATKPRRISKYNTRSDLDENKMSDMRGNELEEEWEDEEDRMTEVSTKNKTDCGKRSDFKGLPFPTTQQYTQSIYASWEQACKTWKLSRQQYPIQKAHKESICNRVNSFQGRLRDVMKDMFEVTHDFHNGKYSEEYIKRKVVGLLPNKLHQKPDSQPGTGWFAHEWVKRAICKVFFMGRHPVAIKFPRKWDPVLHRAVAVVCGFMMYYLHKWKDGKRPNMDTRTGNKAGQKRVKRMNYFDVERFYRKQWSFMKRFRDSPAQRDWCAIRMSDLYTNCLKAVGQKPIDSDAESTDGDFARNDDDEFAVDEPTEEELARIRHRSVSASSFRDPEPPEDDLEAEDNPDMTPPADLDDDYDDGLGLDLKNIDGGLNHEGVGLEDLDDDDEDILGPSPRDSSQPAPDVDSDLPIRQNTANAQPAAGCSAPARACSDHPPKQKVEIVIKTSKLKVTGPAAPKGPRAALKSGRLKVVGAKQV